MENLLTVILHFPALTILWGLLMLCFYKKRNTVIHVLIAVAVSGYFYSVCDAIVVNPYSTPHSSVVTSVVLQILAPLTLAFILCLMWVSKYEQQLPWHQYLWFIIPVALCSVCIMLYCVMGSDNAAQYQQLLDLRRAYPVEFVNRRAFEFFHFIRTRFYHYTVCIYSTVAIIFALHLLRKTGFSRKALYAFFFQGASLPPFHIQMLVFILLLFCFELRIFLGRYFLMDHLWASAAFSFLMACCYILLTLAALSLEFVECTLRQFWFLDPRDDLSRETILEAEAEEKLAKDLASSESEEDDMMNDSSTDQDAVSQVEARIAKGLRSMMDEGHAYLDNNLHIEQVARMLGTNRYYLSRYINENYHINFNEYINRKRLEYAKQHMLQNPDVLLDVIATDCGFSTAQAFARKFKAMEGITPRTWLVQHQ